MNHPKLNNEAFQISFVDIGVYSGLGDSYQKTLSKNKPRIVRVGASLKAQYNQRGSL